MYCAGVPGLEPRLTEPESAGLPITPYPNTFQIFSMTISNIWLYYLQARQKFTPRIRGLKPV